MEKAHSLVCIAIWMICAMTLMKIGNNVTISYGVYFACHGKNRGHLPIVVEDNAYIGMRASIITKELPKFCGGGGQLLEHIRSSVLAPL